MMKKKTLFAAALSGLAALALANHYQQWKQNTQTRSEALSQLIMTPLGPIEYAREGQGPAILIVHGSPGGYDQGIGFARLINSPNFTYIAPSRPGYLRTPLSAGASPEEQADLYAALLDALQIEQAIVLGISGGGPAALQFALRHPHRCRGLVMLCAISQRYVESEVYQQLPLPQRLGKQLINELILSDPFIYLLQSFASLLPARLALADTLTPFSLADQRKEGYHNDMRHFAALAPYPLAEISLPTFISQGTADTEVPFANAQLLANQIPHARFIPVPGANHFFFLTHQHQFLPALHDFLHTLS